MAARFLPYGTNIKQLQMQTEDKCPQCQQLAEGKDHIMQCQAEDALEQWEMLLQQLDDWLQVQQMEEGSDMSSSQDYNDGTKEQATEQWRRNN